MNGTMTRAGLAALVLAAWLAGCAATQSAHVKQNAACGFLGGDCAKLAPDGPEGRIQLRYLNQSVSWTSYDKILLEASERLYALTSGAERPS